MEQVEHILDLLGCEVDVAQSVTPAALLKLDLLKFAQRDPAPPSIAGFPPEPQVALHWRCRRWVDLNREINVHNKRAI